MAQLPSLLPLLVSQALQSNLKYSLLPRRLLISKRLAQCLHPALPSGVHLKALETYEIIFKIVGTKWLAKDLFLYRYSPSRSRTVITRASCISVPNQKTTGMGLGRLLAWHARGVGLDASTDKPGVLVHACNSSTLEVKAGRVEVQGHL